MLADGLESPSSFRKMATQWERLFGGDHPSQPRLNRDGLYTYELDPISDKLVAIGNGIPDQTMYDPESNIGLSGDGTMVIAARDASTNSGIVTPFPPLTVRRPIIEAINMFARYIFA